MNRPALVRGLLGGSLGKLLLGWLAVLVCSLLVYDALLFSSLKKERWEQAQASARIAAESLRLKIAVGIRLGKTLEKYRGLDALVRFASTTAQLPLAILDANGKNILSHGEFPTRALSEGTELACGDTALLREDSRGRSLFLPVSGRDGDTTGYIGVRLDRAPLEAELWGIFSKQLTAQAVFSMAGLLLLMAALHFFCKRKGTSPRFYCMTVFLLVLLANGALALHTASARYTETLLQDAGRTGILLAHDLQRLAGAGVPFERIGSVDTYLEDIAKAHHKAIALGIVGSQGQYVAGSNIQKSEILPEKLSFDLGSGERRLQISLTRGPWLDHLRATALDMITMLAVSLIFMLELFLLLTRGLKLLPEATLPPAETTFRPSSLMRPLAFFMLFAMDMSISFIPLRMAELVPPDHAEFDMLLGLPISAEMGMTGLGVLLAGVWIQRQGARPPLAMGLTLLCLGYLGSMLALSPWHFVLARILVGLGYGLALLTAQACTVRAGLLADMFAGVYAGSLCGSALGAMLAERFGYAPVFLLSAFVLLCLLPLPWYFLSKGEHAEAESEKASASLRFRQTISLLTDRRFLAFSLFSLLPSAILCVGFLNYLLPVYLKGTGAAQSDIGRIYMLNCLLVIYSGPPLSRLVLRARSLTCMVCLAGLVAAVGLLALAVLPPLPATVMGAVCIGLATGLNIPAQSEYLLRLKAAQAIGISQSMSILDALQRVGQVIGPLMAGAALMLMPLEKAAWLLGIGLIVISLLFLPLGRMPDQSPIGEKA